LTDERAKTSIFKDFPAAGAGVALLVVAVITARMFTLARATGGGMDAALIDGGIAFAVAVVAIGFVWWQQVRHRRSVRKRPKPTNLS
jgi:hypothetical protein